MNSINKHSNGKHQSIKMINPQILNRLTTTTFTNTTLFFSNPRTLKLKSPFYPPFTKKTLSPSFSSSIHSFSPKFPQLGLGLGLGLGLRFFQSISSSANPQIPPISQQSDGKFFTWHKPPADSAAVGGGVGGGKAKYAAVVLGWLGATQKHLRRYAEMYTRRGIEAITFVVPVEDVMRCDLGKTVEDRIEIVAKEIVDWLLNGDDDGRSLIFHTFSTTGWLVYGSILAHMEGRPELIEKIKGCIVDSGGDPELNPKVWAAGFGAALLKKRNTQISPLADTKPTTDRDNEKPKPQEQLDIREAAVLFTLETMFTVLFKLPALNQKLAKIISRLSENQPDCPQLYLYSTGDKVVPYRVVESFIEGQKSRGRNVRSHNFGPSSHVDHYRTFPDVYSSLVNSFVNENFSWGN